MPNTHEQLLISTPAMGVRLIAFNRPSTRNALTLQMQATLDEVLAAFEGDQDVGAIVLCGVGDKAFSTGYDIHEMQHFDRSEEHTSELQSLMRISYAVFCLKKKKNTQTIRQPQIHT